jgi:hypothetical protein
MNQTVSPINALRMMCSSVEEHGKQQNEIVSILGGASRFPLSMCSGLFNHQDHQEIGLDTRIQELDPKKASRAGI